MRDNPKEQAVTPAAYQDQNTEETDVLTRCQKSGAPKTPYALSKGEICVQIRASGIPTLCFYTDRFIFRRSPKGGPIYITIADAIAWHENELAFTKRPQRRLKALAVLRDARERLGAELRAEAARAEHADGGMEVA
jgi:hypothetical protein